MEILLLITGLILFVAGAALNLFIKRRQFYRRGPGGLQHFESYRQAVGVSFLERVGKIIAFLLIVLGLFLVASYFLLPGVMRDAKQRQKTESLR